MSRDSPFRCPGPEHCRARLVVSRAPMTGVSGHHSQRPAVGSGVSHLQHVDRLVRVRRAIRGCPHPADPPAGYRGITLALNFGDEQEVDAALRHAVEAGARLVKPASRAEWGVLRLLRGPGRSSLGGRVRPRLPGRRRWHDRYPALNGWPPLCLSAWRSSPRAAGTYPRKRVSAGRVGNHEFPSGSAKYAYCILRSLRRDVRRPHARVGVPG